jgi:hypothetical protein
VIIEHDPPPPRDGFRLVTCWSRAQASISWHDIFWM